MLLKIIEAPILIQDEFHAEHFGVQLNTSSPGSPINLSGVTTESDGGWGNSDDSLNAIDILLLACATCGIIGNTLCVIVLFYHGPLRNKLHNLFLINHSLVDLVVCILLIPTTLTANLSIANAFFCYLWDLPTVFLGLYVSSVYNIVALAIERYMEVVRPIAHRNYVTRPRVIFLLVVIWLFGPAYKMTILLQDTRFYDGVCHFTGIISQPVRNFLAFTAITVEFCVPLLVIVLCYGIMALSLRKESNQLETPSRLPLIPCPEPSATFPLP